MRRASRILARSLFASAGIAVAASCGSSAVTTSGQSARPAIAAPTTADKFADVIAAPLPVAQESAAPFASPPPPRAGVPPPPPFRKEGDLTVTSPPRKANRFHGGGRLRTDVEGSLTKGSPRAWIGIDVPSFVQLTIAEAELFLLDDVGSDGFLAFYREPYNAAGCPLGNSQNCTYGAVLYDRQGGVTWKVALSKLLSRTDHLEIQDIRYAGGVLYFNEACQSYSREAEGRCSALVAYDPKAKRVLWRTPPLTSNNVFAVVGAYVVAGYGFTAEPDHLSIVQRSDGKIVSRLPIPAAHDWMEVRADGTLLLEVYYQKEILFRMDGMDGDAPKLVAIKRSDKLDL